MKAGLTTSVVLHVAAIGFGLITLSAPAPLDAGAQESFPVDLVPMSEIAESVRGDRQAPVAERPAPVPTTRPETVAEAQNVGDNDVDLSTPPTPEPARREVEAAASPPPSPEPTPQPAEEPAPAPEPTPPAPEPEPTPEAAPEPAPQQEATPEPVQETAVAEAAPVPAEVSPLPSSAPAPQARPQPPQTQTAQAPERREPERPREPQQQPAQQQRSDEQSFDEDEVAMLLNRARAQGGGAQRSTETASLGGRQTTGAKLSNSEMGALQSQLQGCWTIPAGAEGAENMRASVSFRLDQSGKLDGAPVVTASSGNRAFDQSAVRAVQICDRAGLQVPANKAEVWASGVVVNFDPSEMF
jgi:colicin import membrane protein